MNKNAIIVGSSGQDGRLLSSLLVSRGYKVTKISRESIITGDIQSDPIDIGDLKQVNDLVKKIKPQEIYFLAAFHHSSEDDLCNEAFLLQESNRVHFIAATAFLEAIRTFSPKSRFFYAASSHVFGEPTTLIQDEKTPLNPDSVYGITKTAGLLSCRYYRETHGVFAAVGIMYNHESSLRDVRFVSKKIATGVALIKSGVKENIVLGDLDAAVDWGCASDFVEAMTRIMDLDISEDFVIATGERHTVREFVDIAFSYANLNYKLYIKPAHSIIKRSAKNLVGNPGRLKKITGWKPKVSFDEMVHRMVQAEMDALL